jgi:hypothetical protein
MTKRSFALLAFAVTGAAAIHTGPEIGAKMPDFQAVDQNGQSHTLTSLLGPKGAVLVVYRSADW